MRDIGTAGENFFSAWCSSVGITSNRSGSDDHGWDLFIEMDNELDSANPLYMHEPLTECKIQIKSTDGDKKSVAVTLSNLKKLATTPLPAFYVLIEFGATQIPKNVYIQHVDNELTSKILSKIRELTSKDKSVKLNKKTMTIRFDESMSVKPLTAETIKNIISRVVGPSHLSYVEQKKTFLSSAGFEKGARSLTFSIDGGENLEQLISMTLGLGGSVPVSDVASFFTRFGVSEAIPNLSSTTAVVEILKVNPEEKGILEMRFPGTGASLAFAVDMYRGGLSSWVPKALRKLRLDSPLLEITIGAYDAFIKLNIKLDNEEPVELNDAVKIYKLCGLLRTPQKIHLTFRLEAAPIRLNLNHTGLDADHSLSLQVLEALLRIKSEFELFDPLPVQLSQIWDNVRYIDLMSYVLGNDFENLTLNFELTNGPGNIEGGHYLGVAELVIGDVLFLAAYAMVGNVKFSGETTYQLIPTQVNILYKTVISSISNDDGSVWEELREIAKNYECKGILFDLIEPYARHRKGQPINAY